MSPPPEEPRMELSWGKCGLENRNYGSKIVMTMYTSERRYNGDEFLNVREQQDWICTSGWKIEMYL